MQRRQSSPIIAFLTVLHHGAAAQPFYPFYPTRSVTVLDGHAWSFGFNASFGDALGHVNVAAVPTPERVLVPSAFDVAEPGVVGRRGTAFYRRAFSLPKGRRGRLLFAACSFFCRVFIDGAEQGSGHSGGGYAPFWVEVPPSGSREKRELLVLADNRWNKTTAPVHTGGDFYMYGGLTRSVVLHTLPPDDAEGAPAPHVEFIGVLALNLTHINVTVTLSGGLPTRPELVTLAFDRASSASASVRVPGAGGTATAAAVAVPRPKAWHPSSPNLHTVRATVVSSGDAVIARFGLRTLGVTADGRLSLNGADLRLKGINRHTMTAASGSALTLAEVERDVALLRQLGVNYVRGAHYPQDQRFLDLCDQEGLL